MTSKKNSLAARLLLPWCERMIAAQASDQQCVSLLAQLAGRLPGERIAKTLLEQAGLYVTDHQPGYLYVSEDRITDFSSVRPALDLDLEYFTRLAQQLVSSKRTLLRFERLFVLWQAAYNVRGLRHPAVEIGSYKGGSAHLIASAFRHFQNSDQALTVIDTFSGHPPAALDAAHDPFHKPGMFTDTSAADVREYLSSFPKVQVLESDFASAVPQLDSPAYSLVHLDVDTYLTTKAALEHFIPRLPPGGVMIVDDFGAKKCGGVTDAVNESLALLAPCALWQMQTEQLVIIKR